jgi:hypothetical protein
LDSAGNFVRQLYMVVYHEIFPTSRQVSRNVGMDSRQCRVGQIYRRAGFIGRHWFSPARLTSHPTQLTVYAAYCTIALMTAAGIFHISRGEASQIGVNIFFAVFAVFIVWCKQKKSPFTTKGA